MNPYYLHRQYTCIDTYSNPHYPLVMSAATKSAQLQIRVSPAEKAAIERAARRAGLDMSAYVLERVFPRLPGRFAELVEGCHKSENERFGLAELSSWLGALSSAELRDAVASPSAPGATPYLANYVAAMVEYACARRNIPPPPWTREIAPLVGAGFRVDAHEPPAASADTLAAAVPPAQYLHRLHGRRTR